METPKTYALDQAGAQQFEAFTMAYSAFEAATDIEQRALMASEAGRQLGMFARMTGAGLKIQVEQLSGEYVIKMAQPPAGNRLREIPVAEYARMRTDHDTAVCRRADLRPVPVPRAS